jgi:transcriptional regulator with XRE-family HTH domain
MAKPDTVGERIRQARVAAGMGLEDLALAMGCVAAKRQGRYDYTKKLQWRTSMRTSTLERLAGVLGCSPQWLAFGGPGGPRRKK